MAWIVDQYENVNSWNTVRATRNMSVRVAIILKFSFSDFYPDLQ